MGRDSVVLLPHLGASTAEAEDNCAVMAVQEIRDYFENGNVINSVNFPKADLGPISGNVRIAFMTKDLDNPVEAICQKPAQRSNALWAATRRASAMYWLNWTPLRSRG